MKKVAIILLLAVAGMGASAQKTTEELIKEGIALHDKGDYEGAVALYDEVLKTSPDHTMALYEKALKEDDWGHQPC